MEHSNDSREVDANPRVSPAVRDAICVLSSEHNDDEDD